MKRVLYCVGGIIAALAALYGLALLLGEPSDLQTPLSEVVAFKVLGVVLCYFGGKLFLHCIEGLNR